MIQRKWPMLLRMSVEYDHCFDGWTDFQHVFLIQYLTGQECFSLSLLGLNRYDVTLYVYE